MCICMCLRACVRVCVRACVRVCLSMCLCICVHMKCLCDLLLLHCQLYWSHEFIMKKTKNGYIFPKLYS